jgi:hypothetical protein
MSDANVITKNGREESLEVPNQSARVRGGVMFPKYPYVLLTFAAIAIGCGVPSNMRSGESAQMSSSSYRVCSINVSTDLFAGGGSDAWRTVTLEPVSGDQTKSLRIRLCKFDAIKLTEGDELELIRVGDKFFVYIGWEVEVE